MSNDLPEDICFQVFAASFEQDDALEYFHNNLDPAVIDQYGKGHGDIYRSLLAMYESTGLEKVSVSSFKQWLKTETLVVDAIGGEEELDSYFGEINAEKKIPEAHEISALLHFYVNKKKRQEKIHELNLLSDDKNDESREKLIELTTEIQDLNRSGIDPLKNVDDGFSIADSAESLWELPDFLPTQFPSLNKAMAYSETGGFSKGSVHAVIAQSGQGKSTLTRSFAINWLDEGHSVVYLNYEEAKPIWDRVLFNQVTGKSVYKFDEYSEEEKKASTEQFKDRMKQWGERLVVRHNPESSFYEDMESWVRTIAARGKEFDVLIIDTLPSLYLRSGAKGQRWTQFESMMVGLERLAKDLQCVIIITAQENSNRMKEGREVVLQSDSGGALTIIQKSAVAIFITKAQSATGDDAIEETVMQLQIPKNRITGTTYEANPPLVKYNDELKLYQEYSMVEAVKYEQGAIEGATIDVDSIINLY